jgi:hypothetical protein
VGSPRAGRQSLRNRAGLSNVSSKEGNQLDASKPIAVGITDSSPSNTALLWAASRARRLRLPLTVLHVLDDRWMAGEALEALPYIDVLRKSVLERKHRGITR